MVLTERVGSTGRVITPGGVAGERINTGGRVEAAGFVEDETTNSRVADARCIVFERTKADGNVAAAGSVA